MQLACFPSIARPCPKTALLGTTWKPYPTYSTPSLALNQPPPSLALKQPMRRQALVTGQSMNWRLRSRFVTRCTQNSEMEEEIEDHRPPMKNDHKVADDDKVIKNKSKAMDTVLPLDATINNENPRPETDAIAEESGFDSNSIPSPTALHGKKKVLELLSSLMKLMGQHVEFLIQPTLHGGMNVLVHCKLVLNDTDVPLLKGSSLHTRHVYKGKATIRDAHKFMEPFFHMQAAQWKIVAFLLPVFHRICPPGVSKSKVAKSVMYCCFAMAFLAMMGMMKHTLF